MQNNQTARDNDTGAIAPLSLTIQDKTFTWPHQYITGAELKRLGEIPLGQTLYMSLVDPYDDVIVTDDEQVNLARPGIERFYVRQPLEFFLEKTKYSWESPFLTGAELRKLGGVEEGDEVWLKVAQPYEDELVGDLSRIDLTRPGIERFYLKKLMVAIRINYDEYNIPRGEHTVSELKKLANVKATDELDQLIDHQLVPLDDSATVMIKGGEQFFAHVRDGSSS